MLAADPPRYLEFEDGFADEDGKPSAEMPTTVVRVTLAEAQQGSTEMAIASEFPSAEAMERLLAMGMEEGMALAVGQIDELLGRASGDAVSSR